MKYTVISKRQFATWQFGKNWCFGQFYHSKIEKETLSNLSFLWSVVFLREREEIFSRYFGPKSCPDVYTVLTSLRAEN